MNLGDPSLGLGEYLTLYAIAAVFLIAVVGVILGTSLGGAIVFFLGIALIIIVGYAILARLYRFLLHGSIRSGGDGGGKGGDI